MSFLKALYYSLFHAISAFCNAGFVLFPDNLSRFCPDLFVNLVIMSLIILGGLGFVVLLDFSKIKHLKKGRSFFLSKIALQTKIALSATIILVVGGAAVIFILERNNVLSSLPLTNKWLASFFQSVTSRTAGFNTLDIAKMADATLFFIISLMFIGASPGSTGGGIKTVTIGILIATIISMCKNKNEVSIFGRVIPRRAIRRVLVVFTLALLWLAIATFLLTFIEGNSLGGRSFLKILFEVTSAFGTVGLSTGITSNLSIMGRLLICLTIFIGRVGLLTIALAIALKEETSYISYPEEKVMIG